MAHQQPTVGSIMTNQFHTVDGEDPLTKVSAIFTNTRSPIIIVTGAEGQLGILTKRILLRPRLNLSQVKAKSLAITAPALKATDGIAEAARLMLQNNLKALPVTEGGKVKGIITAFRVIQSAAENLRKLRLKDVMTRNPVTVQPSDTIGKAVAVMRNTGISRLPVTEKDGLRGIVTVHDILDKVVRPRMRTTIGEAVGEKAGILAKKVSSIMSKPVLTGLPTDKVIKAANLMQQRHVSCIVVVENGSAVGIVTVMDLLEPLARLAEKPSAPISIQVSYKIGNPDTEEKDRVMVLAENFAERFKNSIGQGTLTLYFKQHKEKHGETHLIHCRARLNTDRLQLVGIGEGWRANHAARLALDRIERQFLVSRELASRYPYGDELLDRLSEAY